MNVFLLCFFAWVPFHNASAHVTNGMVCPDFVQILRFQKELAMYQSPDSVPKQVPEQVPESVPEPESIPEDQLEPEVVPERSVKSEPQVAKSPQVVEPEHLEIPVEIPSVPVPRDENVQLASAEELVPNVQPVPAPIAVPIASNVPEVNPTDEPIHRPWGVLTFFIFLLLLSVSANIFLGWQLIEVRKAKLK